MIGWAVKIRCPNCDTHEWQGDIAVQPGVTVLAKLLCRSRECRRDKRKHTYYYVRDGRAWALTAAERERILTVKQN